MLVVAPEGVVSWGAHLLDALDSEGRVKPDHRRRVALELAAYAVNDGQGRDAGDPVHELVTEGRTLANEQRRARGSPECAEVATVVDRGLDEVAPVLDAVRGCQTDECKAPHKEEAKRALPKAKRARDTARRLSKRAAPAGSASAAPASSKVP